MSRWYSPGDVADSRDVVWSLLIACAAGLIAASALFSVGCNALTPAGSEACKSDPCGCLPVECGSGRCCSNGEACTATGCGAARPIVPARAVSSDGGP